MAHSYCTTIDVNLVVRNIEKLAIAQNHRGKGFVEFKEVEIRDFHLSLMKKLFRHIDRPGQHQRRLRPNISECTNTRARLEAESLSSLFRSEQHPGCTVHNARRISRTVNMMEGLNFWMGLNGNSIKTAHRAGHIKGWIELSKRLHICSRTHMLIFGKDCQTILIFDRNDRLFKITFFPSICCSFLAFDRVGVDIVSRKSVFRRNQICGYALRHEIARKA